MSNLIIHNKKEFSEIFMTELKIKRYSNLETKETLNRFHKDMSSYDNNDAFRQTYNYLVKDLESQLQLINLKINITFENLKTIISFIENSDVLEEMCFEEDHDNLYIKYVKEKNTITISNGYGVIVSSFNLNIGDIGNDLITIDELSFLGSFLLGDVTNYIYSNFKNKYSGYEHQLNLKQNLEKINIINAMFCPTPLCINNIEIEKLSFKVKDIRTLDDLHNPYKYNGYDLLNETEFKSFIFEYYSSIWKILNINNELDFENIYSLFKDLKTLVYAHGFSLLMRPSIINWKPEIRFYLNPNDESVPKGFYFSIVKNDHDILNKNIYFHRNHYSYETEVTTYTVRDVISGDFINYLRLLDY